MSTTATKTDFTGTRAALAKFDESKVAREEAWANASSDLHCDRALAADKVALEAVQDAFYQDTAAYNRRENCLRLDIGFIRQIATAENADG
jgi:hypothetical protein